MLEYPETPPTRNLGPYFFPKLTLSAVKGIDISPIQPTFVPPNVRFEVDDFNDEFYDENKYDLIHQRDLHGSVKDPPLFYAECFKALAPGGWIDGLWTFH
jgi:SAM-dependent methyltransferase